MISNINIPNILFMNLQYFGSNKSSKIIKDINIYIQYSLDSKPSEFPIFNNKPPISIKLNQNLEFLFIKVKKSINIKKNTLYIHYNFMP